MADQRKEEAILREELKTPEVAEDESESEESGEDEDEDDDEDEPRLKYLRLGTQVSEILRVDSASCLAVHEKFLALGTHFGHVIILDFVGSEIKRFSQQSVTINEISVNSTGDWIASCSDDGQLYVNNLYSDEKEHFEFSRPVKAVALDPNYGKKGGARQFVTGGKEGILTLRAKGWFKEKETVLHQGEGPIYVIRWAGNFIAWANDFGVKVYDTVTRTKVAHVSRNSGAPRPDLYKPCLFWGDGSRKLVIAWANSVKIGVIFGDGVANNYVMQIVNKFETDGYYISGIAPFGNDFIILAYPDESCSRPELRIVSAQNEEVSVDALPIHGFENYNCLDYRLDFLSTESLYYVVSPKDIVLAKPRDIDDHITWLLLRNKFEQALTDAEEHQSQLNSISLSDVGEKYLQYLFVNKEYVTAARLCPKILNKNAKLWEKWLFEFCKVGQLPCISPFLPISNPQLSPIGYEMVLNAYLTSDSRKFLGTVKEWPTNLYSVQHIITAAIAQQRKYSDMGANPHESPLADILEALAILYSSIGQNERTLQMYLMMKRGNVFELIEKNNLYDQITDKIVLLMEYDTEASTKLLIAHTDRISISSVVKQLEHHRKYLCVYLHALFVKNPNLTTQYQKMQVGLYIEYSPELLLPFFKQSTAYQLEDAYQQCEASRMYKEMVFLQQRMGNNKLALNIILIQLNDVKMALDFAQTQDEPELWRAVFAHAMTHPDFLSLLLAHVGEQSKVDVIEIMRKIPNGMDIPELRDRLVKIISDYNLGVSLREGCNIILKADCVELFDQLYQARNRPCRITSRTKCSCCGLGLLGPKPTEGVLTFFCGHSFHAKCLPATTRSRTSQLHQFCTVCHSKASHENTPVDKSNVKPASTNPTTAEKQTTTAVTNRTQFGHQTTILRPRPKGQKSHIVPNIQPGAL